MTAWPADVAGNIRDRLRGGSHTELEEIRRTGRGGRVHHVTLGDGATLHAEIDGSSPSAVTVIFCHGYTLNLTSWREQRGPIADSSVQRVFYDQRGFGMSESAAVEPATMELLAEDLHRVIEDCAPSGSVILVGHSMGAMVIQALAGLHPELFGPRVVSAVLIATAVRGRDLTLGLPSGLVRQVTKVAPGLLRLLGLRPEIVRAVGLAPYLEIGRLFHARSAALDTRRIFAAMVSANSMNALANYLPAITGYDTTAALPALSGAQVIVVAGEKDVTTTVALNRAVAEAIPESEFVVVANSGHMVPLEQPEVLNNLLRKVIAASAARPRS
ncbi:alpha/beta fold hydrolase [Smaragdicoccus niigatensis]|uniref:alpha/beta fold hydrolase n=1 Tax=Smaragdicoccus niigatensis TaxID=359359 RepID=UPI00138AD520|nr:alpha/beta hydrolase [Smaragdicoccus niigatensis]